MADNDLTAELAAIKERAEAATPGPWWFDEDEDVWRLHGVAFTTPPFRAGDGSEILPGQVVNHQILKAPKTGTPYAEYWPNEADAAFITAARTDIPRMVKALEAALARHTETPLEIDNPAVPPFSYCRQCAGHPKWPCPEVAGILAALAGKAG